MTPAMIEAGVDAFCACRLDLETYEEIVQSIFTAMQEAKKKMKTPL
jgi:hypothetical protein